MQTGEAHKVYPAPCFKLLQNPLYRDPVTGYAVIESHTNTKGKMNGTHHIVLEYDFVRYLVNPYTDITGVYWGIELGGSNKDLVYLINNSGVRLRCRIAMDFAIDKQCKLRARNCFMLIDGGIQSTDAYKSGKKVNDGYDHWRIAQQELKDMGW